MSQKTYSKQELINLMDKFVDEKREAVSTVSIKALESGDQAETINAREGIAVLRAVEEFRELIKPIIQHLED